MILSVLQVLIKVLDELKYWPDDGNRGKVMGSQKV